MTIDEQLREIARLADQQQRVITAAEVVQRVSGQDRPSVAAPTRLDKASAADTDDRVGEIIMLDTEDHTTGAEPTTSHRRPPGRWLLVAAAVAVIALVGTIVAISGDDEDPVDTVSPPTTAAAPAQADPQRTPDFDVTDLRSIREGDPATPETMYVYVSITNRSSSETSDYLVTLTANSFDGATRYDETTVSVTGLEVGQTIQEMGIFTNDIPADIQIDVEVHRSDST